MQPYKYKLLLSDFIAAADSTKYDSLSVDEVKQHAQAKTIYTFLVDRFGEYLDLSTFESDDWTEISEMWSRFAIAADERRKFGVENRGICLLMAYAFTGMQMADQDEKKK